MASINRPQARDEKLGPYRESSEPGREPISAVCCGEFEEYVLDCGGRGGAASTRSLEAEKPMIKATINSRAAESRLFM